MTGKAIMWQKKQILKTRFGSDVVSICSGGHVDNVIVTEGCRYLWCGVPVSNDKGTATGALQDTAKMIVD